LRGNAFKSTAQFEKTSIRLPELLYEKSSAYSWQSR
jgi:hypothetical protein